MEKIAKFVSSIDINKEALASIDNHTLSWMDFVFTDDQPNANKQGVKAETFDRLIETGILMPLKMAAGGIAPGHKGSLPIGVISSLEKNASQLVGRAALWTEEREDDVKLIKEAYSNKKPLNISWELLYSETETDSNGIEWLLDPVVRAATLVGVPAYSGRTSVLAVAASNPEEITPEIVENALQVIEKIPQSNLPADLQTKLQAKAGNILARLKEGKSGDQTMDELEKLQKQLEQANADLEAAQKRVKELEPVEAERNQLQEYKDAAEKEKAEAAKLESRLTSLKEKGVEFSAEELEKKRSMLVNLDDEAFSFLATELASIKTAKASGKEEKLEVPGTFTSEDGKSIVDVVREGLKELKESKNK